MDEKLDISILGDEKELDYRNELKCDESSINEDLKFQPALYAFYAILEENAEACVAKCKLTLDLCESALDQVFRDSALKSGSKITEAQIFNMIKSEETRVAVVQELNEAKTLQGKLHAIREAFAQRKEVLIALASNMRAQLDTTLIIKDKKEKL